MLVLAAPPRLLELRRLLSLAFNKRACLDTLGFLLLMIVVACLPDRNSEPISPEVTDTLPDDLSEGLVEADSIPSNDPSDLILGTEGEPCGDPLSKALLIFFTALLDLLSGSPCPLLEPTSLFGGRPFMSTMGPSDVEVCNRGFFGAAVFVPSVSDHPSTCSSRV